MLSQIQIKGNKIHTIKCANYFLQLNQLWQDQCRHFSEQSSSSVKVKHKDRTIEQEMLIYYFKVLFIKKRRSSIKTKLSHCYSLIMNSVKKEISTNILFFFVILRRMFLDKAQDGLGSMFTEFNWLCLAAERRHQTKTEEKPSLPSVMASIFMLSHWAEPPDPAVSAFLPTDSPRLSTTSVLYVKGINWTAHESSFQSELGNAVVARVEILLFSVYQNTRVYYLTCLGQVMSLWSADLMKAEK